MVVWESQGVGSIEIILSVCKQRVRDVFTQNWHSRLENSTKARCYISRATFQFQKYLQKYCKISEKFKSFTSIFTHNCLRLSSHRLEVEVGRWAKPNKVPYENRKCKICNILEDEFHFLLECPLYAELRKRYINKYYWRRPNKRKLFYYKDTPLYILFIIHV